MIDSIELKKFIIRYYLDHSISPIEEISKKVSLYLTNHFIPLESVKVEKTNQIGKILSCAKDSYTVEVEGSIVKLRFEELSRNETISALEVRRFLEANTKISPFGRVLRKNVLQQISQSNKEIKDDKDFNQNNKSKEIKEDKIIFSYDPKIEINKKEIEKKRKKEKLSETINYNTRNFTANEFLKSQNEKSSFFKKELLYDDQPKSNLFLPTEQKSEKSKIQNFSLGTQIKKKKNEPITQKSNNESELLTLKIKEILKNYTFKTVTGENDLHFKRKIISLLDSKAIKNHPEEINIKRKLIELLINPNSTNEFINFRVTELFNNTEKKKLKVEEKINFLALLNEEVYEEILIEGVEDNDRFFSVFLFFYYFRKYFKFEFTFLRFKEFILGKKEELICNEENQPIILLDSKSNSEIFFYLIKCTLEMIQEEFKLISKSQFKSLVENSLTISVKEPKEEGYSPSKKYDWHECEITLENYKNILKNFYSFIFNSLELEKITGLSEINTVSDKLNNLYFLIQCCYSTNKFRQIINLSVEDNRILEKNKYDFHARLKTLQSKLCFQPENKEILEEEIKVIENQLTKINYNLLTSGYKAEFALIDDCLFIFLDGVCLWRDHKFYKMSIEQLKRFIDRLKKNPKVYGSFYNSLSWWLEMSFKQN